ADLLEDRIECHGVLALRAREEERPAFRPLGGETFEKGLDDRPQQLQELLARQVLPAERLPDALCRGIQPGAHVLRDVLGAGPVQPLLAAEVVLQSGQTDTCVPCNGARGGSLIAELAEELDPGFEQALARMLAAGVAAARPVAPSGAACIARGYARSTGSRAALSHDPRITIFRTALTSRLYHLTDFYQLIDNLSRSSGLPGRRGSA